MASSLTLVNFDRPRQTSASSTPKKRTVDPRESGLNTGVGALQGCNRGSRGAMSSRRRTDVRIATRPGPLGVPTVVSPPGKPNPHPVDRLYRRTDRDAGMGAAKSIFQIGGAGAVGTGSIRGMPQLLTLAEQDVQIWPFSADGWPRVVEIYPRALTGRRGRAAGQRGTRTCAPAFPTSPTDLLERAAGWEDAFDAAVSGLMMGAHEDQFHALTQASDPDYAIEGRIWRPE